MWVRMPFDVLIDDMYAWPPKSKADQIKFAQCEMDGRLVVPSSAYTYVLGGAFIKVSSLGTSFAEHKRRCYVKIGVAIRQSFVFF